MADFFMTDEQLAEVAGGKRAFDDQEKAWALETHDFLFEYVDTQGGGATLTDVVLAKEIQDGSYDYVACTC